MLQYYPVRWGGDLHLAWVEFRQVAVVVARSRIISLMIRALSQPNAHPALFHTAVDTSWKTNRVPAVVCHALDGSPVRTWLEVVWEWTVCDDGEPGFTTLPLSQNELHPKLQICNHGSENIACMQSKNQWQLISILIEKVWSNMQHIGNSTELPLIFTIHINVKP